MLRSQTWRTVENSAAYAAEAFESGVTVLDVGCGPGTITVDIAQRVAPGRVVGVDVEESILARAKENAHEAGVDNVEFLLADVTDLQSRMSGYGSFHVVHAHQVLMHLVDPVSALKVMLGAVRPGGIVAVRDGDYGTATIWPADPRLARWLEIYHLVARAGGTEPDAGRRLMAWAHAAGAEDVTPSASIWCHATPVERAWWGGQWAERIVSSTIAERAVSAGFATSEELQEISAAWREWRSNSDGWFAISHGEIVCRVPAEGQRPTEER